MPEVNPTTNAGHTGQRRWPVGGRYVNISTGSGLMATTDLAG